MKTNLIALFSLAIVALFSSCGITDVKVSDTITTESHSITGYDEIEISDEFKVFLEFSDTEEKIEIEANKNLHDVIIVEKVADRLVIRTKDNLIIRGDDQMAAYITTKDITKLEASGESQFILENDLITDDLDIDLSGESEIEGNIEVNQLGITLSGEAVADLSGLIDRLDLKASGSSEFSDFDLVVENADLDISGDTEVFLTLNGKMDITASGESKIYYKGDGVIDDENLSGEARVRKMD